MIQTQRRLYSPPFEIFRLCATFFESFLFPYSPPPSFFDILRQTGFSKAERLPTFAISKTLCFFSFSYSADFRHSRLVIIIVGIVRSTAKLFVCFAKGSLLNSSAMSSWIGNCCSNSIGRPRLCLNLDPSIFWRMFGVK